VVNEVIATPAVVVATPAVVVPTYGVSYSPSSCGSDETNRLLEALLQEQRALRQEVANLKAGGAAQPRDPKVLLRANCARCHTEGQLAAGTEFSMFDQKGELYGLSAIDRKVMAKRLQAGTMPPPERDNTGLRVQKMIAADRTELASLLLNPPPAPKPQPAPEPTKEPPAPPPAPKIPPASPSGAALKQEGKK
jgi:hypothetical protein